MTSENATAAGPDELIPRRRRRRGRGVWALLRDILVIVSLPTPAMGLGQLDRGGDYVMLTYQFLANWELVMITDGAVGRMAAYFYNLNNQTILLWDSVELARFMRQGGRAGAGGAGGS